MTKRVLVKVGEHTPDSILYSLNGVVNYLDVGAYMRRRGFATERRCGNSHAVFDRIAADVAERRVLYLEFGVAGGQSMRYWSGLLRNRQSVLHGFDSFEGLPTHWIRNRPAGFFSTEGLLPRIDDGRVQLFKGWFDQTLPHYTPPEHDVLVVNCDADLYSSTVTILATVEPWLTPGSFIYFDEFNHRSDERRAFDELLERTGIGFELFAASRDNAHVAFRVLTEAAEHPIPASDEVRVGMRSPSASS